MAVSNRKIADLMNQFADILEILEVKYKPRAYRNAALSIQSLENNIQHYIDNDTLEEIDGVGAAISSKIKEYIKTGTINELEELKTKVPGNLVDLLQIEGLGPKKVNKLYKELSVKDIEELREAAEAGKIRNLSGFGETTEKNILDGINRFYQAKGRSIRGFIQPIAERITDKISKEVENLSKIKVAGSLRRRKATIGDIDILVEVKGKTNVMEYFTSMEEVDRVLAHGEKKSSIITKDNLQIDLRIIEPTSFWTALQYFTGSKEHNIKLRKLAISQDYKLSEYAIEKNGIPLTINSEQDIYKNLGLSYIPPELREDRGEIESAQQNDLPELIAHNDVKADLHVHTTWSEGSDTIEDMVKEGIKRQLEYIVISDHTKALPIANGMDEDRLLKQIDKIKEVNDNFSEIEVFAGAELNILPDGSVDISDDVLSQLDYTIAGVHSAFKQDEDQITNRIIKALEQNHVNAIAHPTGRVLQQREPYAVNLNRIVEKANELGKFLEINGTPTRMDLSDIDIYSMRNKNIKFSLGSDAHSISQLRYLDYAVDNARRGWLTSQQVINCLKSSEFKKLITN